MQLKVTSWNVEHSSSLIGDDLDKLHLDRRRRVASTIREINPDILCMLEAPVGEGDITSFAKDVLDNHWVPILLPQSSNSSLGDRDDDYDINGTQWIWYLVRSTLANRCRLQEPATWQAFVDHSRWDVHYWGKEKPTRHRHYRHPQVLVFELDDGQEIEFIGIHLKSKINKKKLVRDGDGNIVGDYLNEALKARIKLATEARNVRSYIDARFDQSEQPGIVILGDANDGPGQDYFEQRYMFFDLISNLQGSIMKAERFFNHALFDYPEHLRWTAKYRNQVTGVPASKNPLLIDHILMSQPLVDGSLPIIANEGAGLIKHHAFDRGNAGASIKRITSDHRPVSVLFDAT